MSSLRRMGDAFLPSQIRIDGSEWTRRGPHRYESKLGAATRARQYPEDSRQEIGEFNGKLVFLDVGRANDQFTVSCDGRRLSLVPSVFRTVTVKEGTTVVGQLHPRRIRAASASDRELLQILFVCGLRVHTQSLLGFALEYYMSF
jgi:hypothetical protein